MFLRFGGRLGWVMVLAKGGYGQAMFWCGDVLKG
jgi:hypothetical protein